MSQYFPCHRRDTNNNKDQNNSLIYKTKDIETFSEGSSGNINSAWREHQIPEF